MKKILFQGDSITDCSRSREADFYMGMGYAAMVSGRLGLDNPGEYEFLNRGVSGNRIVDVYARIKSDIINLKPDYMSILIGVNDVWHEAAFENGVDAEKFEMVYNLLIDEIKAALPNIKLMILEPFVLKGETTGENWGFFETEVLKRAEAAKRVAEKHGLTFVPLQKRFDEMAAIQPEPYWTKEGVHPSAAGHELIAREWVKAFEAEML